MVFQLIFSAIFSMPRSKYTKKTLSLSLLVATRGMLKMAEKISWKTIEKYFAGIYQREIGKLENVRNFLLENVLRKIGKLEIVLAKLGSWKMSETESWKLS